MNKILVLSRIKIHNANALSSPYTIGFPAMTAWLGSVHALQLKLNKRNTDFEDLQFKSVAVISHEFNLHTYKGSGDFNHSIISTSNPLKKDGKRPSTIEEARCHLTVSLVVEYSGIDQDEAVDMLDEIPTLLYSIKMAAGDVLSFQPPTLKKINNQQDTKMLMAKLMPGFCLIERRDLVKESMMHGLDGIDALLEYLTVNSHCEIIKSNDGENDKVEWTQTRKQAGWLVPIAIGFQGITELAQAQNQRNKDFKHRFAESVITLGEFIMPTRIEDIDNMLWHYSELEKNLYLCQQNQPYSNEQE